MLRQEPFLAVYLLFEKDTELFLLRRKNTGWKDGYYSLPAGHVDKGENATSAAIREAREEVGIMLRAIDLTLVHVMHRKGDDRERIDFYYKVQVWNQEPYNAEINKCDDAQWFSFDSLPNTLIDNVRISLKCYKNNIFYSEFGWIQQEKL